MEKLKKTREYIKESWARAIKKKDVNADFIMPCDYIPPCVNGNLNLLFYWDTYFTNLGLYLDGRGDFARGHIENLCFALRRFGCVPNVCKMGGADFASQPPLLFLMVKDYYEFSKDRTFLRERYEDLKIEYDFWMTKRISENGLNRYGFNFDYNRPDSDFDYYARRMGVDISSWTLDEKIEFAQNRNTEGESGEDHTPRFSGRAKYINPIDLNCLLYGFERTMADFCHVLDIDEEGLWLKRAEKRLRLLNEYCLDKEAGVYFDYDFQNKVRAGIYCVACYLPFVFGISDDKFSLDKINSKLILDHGVTSCEKLKVQGVYQWGYPNVWAPHQFWAYKANENCDNRPIARLIAEKYLKNVATTYEKKGILFEKYDGLFGGEATVNEYKVPEMLGWTAGVYNYFYSKIKG